MYDFNQELDSSANFQILPILNTQARVNKITNTNSTSIPVQTISQVHVILTCDTASKLYCEININKPALL